MAPGCVVRSSSATTAAATLAEHDHVRATLDGQGAVVELVVARGRARGIIARYEPAPLTAPDPHNGRVHLQDGRVFELSFTKDHSVLTLPGLKQSRAIACRLDELEQAIKPGLEVEIVYCPDPLQAVPRIRRMDAVAPPAR